MTAVANPVLPGCHPDPSVCRVGDDYYLVTSTFEYLPGLPVFRSRDLAHWEPVGHAVRRQLDLSGLPSSSGLYAPTIRHHDGLFWVVCTLVDQRADGEAADERRPGLGHFLVTAADPAGPWSEPAWLGGDGIVYRTLAAEAQLSAPLYLALRRSPASPIVERFRQLVLETVGQS